MIKPPRALIPRDFGNIICVSFWLWVCGVAHGQSNQSWNDYTLNLPFANVYVWDTEFSYKTLLSKESKWSSLEITPDIERAVTQHIDVMFSVGASLTKQKEAYNTVEIKPLLGMRYTFTPNNRVLLRGLVRVEQRNMYHQETTSWDHSTRSRFRLESIIPINRKTYYEDKLWYGLLDGEAFWVMDKQLEERYASQARFRVGIGHRHSYTWRFEFIYTDQFTQDNIDGGFHEASNIFQILIKHYINKSKPALKDPDN